MNAKAERRRQAKPVNSASESHVIARRFRPQTFDQVVGQEAITRTLANALTSGRIHHAYLFTGARGTGKTTTARIFAKALNCERGITAEPCGVCSSCTEIAASSALDVLEIDAASNTGVQDVRDVIIGTVQITPARDRFKLFIIDEVHQLSPSAFNALLKTLEEPPPHVKFIMATTELHKVPETILSRCQIFEFRTISLNKILSELRRITDELEVTISDSALLSIARAGEGSMRDAESALDQVISFAGQEIKDDDVSAALGLADLETLNETVRAIAAQDSGGVLRIVEEVVTRGYDLRSFCREMMVHFRALLVVKIAGFDQELVQMPQAEADTLVKLADEFSEQDLIRFFSILTKTEVDIRTSSQPRLQLEMGLLKLVHAGRLYLIEDALKRLDELEGRRASGGGSAPSTQSQPSTRGSGARAVTPRPAPTQGRRIESQSADRRDAPGSSVPPPEAPPVFDEPADDAVGGRPLSAASRTSGVSASDPIERIKSSLEQRRKMMLVSALEHAERIDLVGDSLRIEYSPEHTIFKKNIEAKENRKTIEDVAREVLGRAISVAAAVGGQAVLEPTGDRESLKARAEADPAVRAVVKTFRGEIVDVVKPDK